ncbi:TRAP transporter small permease [bacterium]|nr:TRAP transporter small permease [bacterium]
MLKILDRWEEYALFGFMISMLAVLLVQVFCRYVLSFSFSWAEQAARIGFVWLTMIGISIAAKKGLHLKVDMLNQILPRPAGRIVSWFSNLATILFGFIMCWLILKTVLMQIRLNQVFSSIPWLPTWTMYIAGTVGMLGLSLRTIQYLILESKQNKKEIGEEQ